MSNKISIIIPCYNQTTLLEKNLHHLEKQTFKDFDITIIDDKSTENYQEVISKFPNLKIIYTRNEKNLGAIGNLFNSILYKTDSIYKTSLHEDDIFHPQYLEKAIEILENNPRVAFVVTIAEWFKNENELGKKISKLDKDSIDTISIVNKTEFIKKILDGKHITFGSVIYRNSALSEKPDFNKYDVLCDRPFLISLLKNNLNAAIVENLPMFVMDHGENDNRFKKVTEENCFNMMYFYKNNLTQPINSMDLKRLLIFSTNNLLNAYPGIKNKKNNLYHFIKTGKKLNLIKLRYINKIGIVGILKLFFGEKIINKLVRQLK